MTGIVTEDDGGVITTYASMAEYQATYAMSLDTDLGVSRGLDLSTLEVNAETGALEGTFGDGFTISIDPATGVVTDTSADGVVTVYESMEEMLTETGHSDLLDDGGGDHDDDGGGDFDHDAGGDVDAGGGFDGVD